MATFGSGSLSSFLPNSPKYATGIFDFEPYMMHSGVLYVSL